MAGLGFYKEGFQIVHDETVVCSHAAGLICSKLLTLIGERVTVHSRIVIYVP